MVAIEFRENPLFDSNGHQSLSIVVSDALNILRIYRQHQELHQICFQALHRKMLSNRINQAVPIKEALSALLTG